VTGSVDPKGKRRASRRRPAPEVRYITIEPDDGRWFGETWVFRLRTPRARRRYVCASCDEEIPKGTCHVMYVTRDQEGPGWETWRLHGECYLEKGRSRCNSEKRPDWRWEP
jgi:hypothetical protein